MQSNPLEFRDGIDIDPTNTPLEALSDRSRKLFYKMLNEKRTFTSEEGYCRDWRGAFDVIGIPEGLKPLVAAFPNPAEYMIELWEKESTYCARPPNLAELQTVLGCIDRWDIVDDTSKMFREDAIQFLSRQPTNLIDQIPVDFCDMDIITKDDTDEHIQHYDAFILYTSLDNVFVSKMIEHLENGGMRLCLQDRDVLVGRKCEFDVLSRLITNRCRRLIVVVSQALVEDPINSFAAAVSAAWTNEHRERKLIPCLIDRCEVPYYCRQNFVLDYSHHPELYDFWDKLRYLITD